MYSSISDEHLDTIINTVLAEFPETGRVQRNDWILKSERICTSGKQNMSSHEKSES